MEQKWATETKGRQGIATEVVDVDTGVLDKMSDAERLPVPLQRRRNRDTMWKRNVLPAGDPPESSQLYYKTWLRLGCFFSIRRQGIAAI